jgi:hypothetical protein
MDTAAFFTENAAQCRRLAAAAIDYHAAEALLARAEEFEAQAAECAAHEDSEKTD